MFRKKFRGDALLVVCACVQGERALFLACHRLCFAWIDEWYGMTLDQIREMERQTDLLLKKVSMNRKSSTPCSATMNSEFLMCGVTDQCCCRR